MWRDRVHDVGADGPDTLAHVLRDTGLSIIITRADAGPRVGFRYCRAAIARHHGGLGAPDTDRFGSLVDEGSPDHEAANTSADDPALLMYERLDRTSEGHAACPSDSRRLPAHGPTLLRPGDGRAGRGLLVALDWAWVGGLLDLVLPAWAHGQTVVSWNGRFDAARCFELMARHRVTHSFVMTPTALKRLAEVTDPRDAWALRLRYVCTGGESLPGEVVRWGASSNWARSATNSTA